MTRAQRFLTLVQLLRQHRFPVTGADLAAGLGISLRTLYRDIAALREQGAPIEGEPGLGYVLKPGFLLPPLMFSADEIEALVLGTRWVMKQTDVRLGEAARVVISKIAAVLPPELRHELETSALLVGSSGPVPAVEVDLATVRSAIRTERKLEIGYRDLQGQESKRVIWPFALGFFEHVRVVAAWCELRDGFRHFRTDRIVSLAVSEMRYPRRRQALLKEWRQIEGIPAQ